MRVLFVTNDHPLTGYTGVSMYCRDLIPALLNRGVDVGAVYIQHRDWKLRPYVRVSQEHNVSLFTIVNSPLHPEDSIFKPEQDSRQASMEALIASCIERFAPDVFHVQTFHGYPGSILRVARSRGARTAVTLHDFWALCARVLLVRPRGDACEGPSGGLNCVRFCALPRPWRQHVYQWGTRLPEGFCQDAFLLARALYRRLTLRRTSMWTLPPTRSMAAPMHLLTPHANRSRFLLQAISEADVLLAVSEFTKSVYVRHGIDATTVRVLPATLAISDHIPWKPRCVENGQVRFAFLGRLSPLKGAHVFAAAVRDLARDRARFLMFGPAEPESIRYLAALAGDDRLEFRGPYARHELPQVLDQADVVVVPSTAQETVGLVTLEAFSAGLPVIGARIGAIPEYVRDGETGFLFNPGDPGDLRAKMARFLADPSLVATMSTRTRPPAPMQRHVEALLDLYRMTVEKGGQTPWTASSV